MKKNVLVPIILIISLLISGCSIQESQSDNQAASNSLTITDALGREVVFDTLPQRIVIAGRGATLLIDAAYLFPGASSKLVSLPAKGTQDITAFIQMIDPDTGSKTVIENEIGPEQLAALKPDVVLLKPYLQDQLGKPLEVLGIKVVYLSMETPEEFFRDLSTLGKLLGDEKRSAEIISYYQEQQNKVMKGLSGISESDYPRILLLYYSNRDGEVAFNVPPLTWIQTTLVKTSAAIPVWQEIEIGSGWTKVSFEQVAAWNPDQIYIIAYFDNPLEVVASLKADPQWAMLSAVQNNQLHAFPKDAISWDQADPRWIIGLTWLAKTTHPDRFSEMDIFEEVQTFFMQMYNMDEQTFKEKLTPFLIGVTP